MEWPATVSAHDAMQQAQFLHASPHKFRPGDMVEPGHEPNFNMSSPKQVYAAKYADRAVYYKEHFQSPGDNDPAGVNTSPTAHIYKVQPMGKVTQDPGDKDAVRSRAPMKVVGRAVYMKPEKTWTDTIRSTRAKNKENEKSDDPYKQWMARTGSQSSAHYSMLEKRRSRGTPGL